MKRAFGCLLAALTIIATFALPGTAWATPGDLTCEVSSAITYDPGLTLSVTTQHVTFEVNYTGCTSLNNAEVSYTTIEGEYDADFSCLVLPDPANVEFTITWDDSSTSDIEGTGTYTTVGGQSVYTTVGEVADGLFEGDTFVEVITESTLNLLACVTTGVTSQTGFGVVTFN